jgi:hypothetical protein
VRQCHLRGHVRIDAHDDLNLHGQARGREPIRAIERLSDDNHPAFHQRRGKHGELRVQLRKRGTEPEYGATSTLLEDQTVLILSLTCSYIVATLGVVSRDKIKSPDDRQQTTDDNEEKTHMD